MIMLEEYLRMGMSEDTNGGHGKGKVKRFLNFLHSYNTAGKGYSYA